MLHTLAADMYFPTHQWVQSGMTRDLYYSPAHHTLIQSAFGEDRDAQDVRCP